MSATQPEEPNPRLRAAAHRVVRMTSFIDVLSAKRIVLPEHRSSDAQIRSAVERVVIAMNRSMTTFEARETELKREQLHGLPTASGGAHHPA